MKNIFLIGMMGSWKSTVGKKISQSLNMKFIDIDDQIELMTKMKISEIFQEFGETRFREMEKAYFVEKAKQDGHVFSTGGGIVLNSQNRQVLFNFGKTFFLKASIKTLAERIKNTTKRPLLDNSDNIQENLETIWIKRKNLYNESSHYCIETDKLNPDMVVKKMLNILKVPIE